VLEPLPMQPPFAAGNHAAMRADTASQVM
jgi:hypothetical protein